MSSGSKSQAKSLQPPFSKVQIDVIAGFHDARGIVFQPLEADQIAGYRNVHVVVSAPGAIRGNHRHSVGCEISSVVGPMLVRLREDGETREYAVPAGEIWRFAIPAGVGHAFKNNGTQVALLASFNTEEYDPAHPDAEREILFEA